MPKENFNKPRPDLFEELKYTSVGILMKREDKSAMYAVKELNNTSKNFAEIWESLSGMERIGLLDLASQELRDEVARRIYVKP